MKSTFKKLESRGYVEIATEQKYSNINFQEKITLLQSKLPADRTLGARLLIKNSNLASINYLIEALRIETKLYSKIEICNTLASFEKEAVDSLINQLGEIGSNQYSNVPEKQFLKKNYPLPRDICSRILIRIGEPALPNLVKELTTNDLKKLSEVIDAIGFICFYNQQNGIFDLLKKCYYRNEKHDLIKWKLIRAMSAFSESEKFLKQIFDSSNDRLKLEIKRSLKLLINKI